jgi:thiamine-phosphate pyrophosphorylase
MSTDNLIKALRFYFISDDQSASLAPYDQVRIAIEAGATTIQYRRKDFNLRYYDEALAIRQLCRANTVPFIVNDHVLLAQALAAEGVHLGQTDEDPGRVRHILGPRAIIGISVSNLYELNHTDLAPCDYIGSGPVFPTTTKADAKKVRQLTGLEEIAQAAPLPVVAIGGIDHTNASACFQYGATGIAVISAISRAADPLQNALKLSAACGCSPRDPQLPPSEAI